MCQIREYVLDLSLTTNFHIEKMSRHSIIIRKDGELLEITPGFCYAQVNPISAVQTELF